VCLAKDRSSGDQSSSRVPDITASSQLLAAEGMEDIRCSEVKMPTSSFTAASNLMISLFLGAFFIANLQDIIKFVLEHIQFDNGRLYFG